MKRDMNLVKAILEHLEQRGSSGTRLVKSDGFPGYSKEAVHYHTRLCIQAGFISEVSSDKIPLEHSLAWEGHDFLSSLRAAEGLQSEEEAGRILQEMYSAGLQRGDAVNMVYAFTFMYAEDLAKMDPRKIVECAGIPENYSGDISKGIKVAKSVIGHLGGE